MLASALFAQKDTAKNKIEIYGSIIAVPGYNFKSINPGWDDIMLVSELPSYDGQYAPNGRTYFSVRPTNLGIKFSGETFLGNSEGEFSFDLFDTDNEEGKTSFHLLIACMRFGKFAAGQLNTTFMDEDLFPDITDYWGPSGMVFLRNIQFRYTPVMNEKVQLAFALENPGASGDGGLYADRIELKDVRPLFNVPDFTASFRIDGNWGHIKAGGILGSIKWRDYSDTARFDLNGSAVRRGLNITSNIIAGKNDVLKLGLTYGHAIGNYMNDAPIDIGLQKNPGDTLKPIAGVALPVTGLVAFIDHTWNKYFTSSAGYSLVQIENSDAQAVDAFHKGQYVIANVLWHPSENFTAGIEYQWGQRNSLGGYISTDTKLQFFFRYDLLYKAKF